MKGIMEAIKNDPGFNPIIEGLGEEKADHLNEWLTQKFTTIFQIIKDEQKLRELYKQQRDDMIDVIASILNMSPEEVCLIYFPIKNVTPDEVNRMYLKNKGAKADGI